MLTDSTTGSRTAYRYTVEVRRETSTVDGLMDALPYKYSLIRAKQ